MITVSVQTDISQAMRMLNLLPKEAERAASRAINKIADEIKKDSVSRIVGYTGIDAGRVEDRFYVKGANPTRLIAVVAALRSARNVGYEKGASPEPGKAGVTVTAWRNRTLYDRTFVKGRQDSIRVRRKVFKRTGPGKNDIDGRVWGPSVPRTFAKPWMQQRARELIAERWPHWFERYLREEIRRLRGTEALRGVGNVAPFLNGPTIL